MQERELDIISGAEQVLQQAQPERKNISFVISFEAACTIRDSISGLIPLGPAFQTTMLKRIMESIRDYPDQIHSHAYLSEREMDIVNTLLLIKMKELREVDPAAPVSARNHFIDVNLSYIQQGGNPSEIFQEFCKNMTG